jgi:hypothetical protein
MKYDIYNPTTARRIIHNGLEESRQIEILPRSSVTGVELADIVASKLIARSKADLDGELRLTEHVTEVVEEDGPKMKLSVDDSKVSIVKAKR